MNAAFPRPGILLLATFAMGACLDSGAPLAPDTPGAIGGGVGGGGSALVGEWSRTLIFTTDDGDIHSSRTIWWFDADGSAERWVIATSLAAEFADTVTAAALWDADGVRVTIAYQPPAAGTVTFDYTVRSDTLTLGGDFFVRAD
jgi:hypothetical protein